MHRNFGLSADEISAYLFLVPRLWNKMSHTIDFKAIFGQLCLLLPIYMTIQSSFSTIAYCGLIYFFFLSPYLLGIFYTNFFIIRFVWHYILGLTETTWVRACMKKSEGKKKREGGEKDCTILDVRWRPEDEGQNTPVLFPFQKWPSMYQGTLQWRTFCEGFTWACTKATPVRRAQTSRETKWEYNF